MNKYKITVTGNFEEELRTIYYYVNFFLKEPITAKCLYNDVIKIIASLDYFPERYSKVSIKKRYKNSNIRKLLIYKYVIIYEVNNNTRSSLCFTYISYKSKLFKSFVIII